MLHILRCMYSGLSVIISCWRYNAVIECVIYLWELQKTVLYTWTAVNMQCFCQFSVVIQTSLPYLKSML